MNIKNENGIVTFIMRAGKDKVRSTMTLSQARRIIFGSKNVVETDTEIIVDDKWFFPSVPEEKPKKSRGAKKDE